VLWHGLRPCHRGRPKVSPSAPGGRSTLASTYHDTRTRETNDAGATVNTDVLREHSRVLPVVELGLGLVWEAGGYRVRIGYELQNWFSHADRIRG